MVPWPQGWARFVAPLVLMLALCFSATGTRYESRWWVGAAFALVGLSTLLYSAWFVSPGGAAAFIGLNAFIALCFYVDRRFGRAAAFVLMLVTALSAVYIYAPR